MDEVKHLELDQYPFKHVYAIVKNYRNNKEKLITQSDDYKVSALPVVGYSLSV